MEFDENFIGKIKISEDLNSGDAYIIVGYDYIGEYLLAYPLNIGRTNYVPILDKDLKDIYSFDEIVNKYKNKINYLKNIENICFKARTKLLEKHDLYTIDNLFNRIYECNQNVKNVTNAKRWFQDIVVYERELRNANKGLKRALKRLYSLLEFEDYYEMIDFLENNNYDIGTLKIKLNTITAKYDYFVNHYDKFKKNVKMPNKYF